MQQLQSLQQQPDTHGHLHMLCHVIHAVLCWSCYEPRRLAGRPQTPSGGMARPGTSSERPGSALRPPALGVPAVSAPSSTVPPHEAQLEAAAATAAAAPQPSSGRQVITSARTGQLPVVAGARPASAGLKRPASAAGLYQIPKWKQSSCTLPLQQVGNKTLHGMGLMHPASAAGQH